MVIILFTFLLLLFFFLALQFDIKKQMIFSFKLIYFLQRIIGLLFLSLNFHEKFMKPKRNGKTILLLNKKKKN